MLVCLFLVHLLFGLCRLMFVHWLLTTGRLCQISRMMGNTGIKLSILMTGSYGFNASLHSCKKVYTNSIKWCIYTKFADKPTAVPGAASDGLYVYTVEVRLILKLWKVKAISIVSETTWASGYGCLTCQSFLELCSCFSQQKTLRLW